VLNNYAVTLINANKSTISHYAYNNPQAQYYKCSHVSTHTKHLLYNPNASFVLARFWQIQALIATVLSQLELLKHQQRQLVPYSYCIIWWSFSKWELQMDSSHAQHLPL